MKYQSVENENVRDLLRDSANLVLMYVGNLEEYQGIDLLLQSFEKALDQGISAELFIIGGEEVSIKHYKKVSKDLGILDSVHFLGPRPVNLLSYYLGQADILASPRIKGKNTPMKVYSYLGSGKAVIATNLETHTQVLTDSVAMLAEPDPDNFAQGLLKLSADSLLRQSLGHEGRRLIQENYSMEAFTKRANELLDLVQMALGKPSIKTAVNS